MSMSDLYFTPSKGLARKISSTSDEILSLGPICLNIDIRYKINVKFLPSFIKLTIAQIFKKIGRVFDFGATFSKFWF